MNPVLVDIDTLVQEARGFEPLPDHVVRLADIVARSDFQVPDLASFFHADEMLRERLFAWANQGLQGSPRRVSNVEGAVVRVGPGVLLGLSLGAALAERMQRAVPEYGLAEGELWQHSVVVGIAIDQARFHARTPVEPVGFGAGLVHDIGKLVLANHLDAKSLDLFRSTEKDLRDEDSEMEILRICHAELGGLVVRRWSLPELLAEGVEAHHSPLRGASTAARRLALHVALGDAVATQLGHGCGETYTGRRFGAALAGGLGLSQDGFEALCREVDRRLEGTLSIFH